MTGTTAHEGYDLIVLIPAHNEEESIGRTITATLNQERPADKIVVIPNGCTDRTADVAREFPVTVMELPRLAHRKSEALNRAWAEHAQDADIVVCLDADTELPPNALRDWEQQMGDAPGVGGISSKFTMLAPDLLSRIQKAEFATWTQTALDRGSTTVLAGTGCAIRGEALRLVASRADREGPWSYVSATEDFELTYRIRELGYKCIVSPTVRAYTDSMKTVKALWGQRMKWQTGTVQDLLAFGVNRLTLRDWCQQVACIFNVLAKALLVAFWAALIITNQVNFIWFWWLLPVLFVALDFVRSRSIPHRDRTDTIIALSFFPMEFFMWMRAAWTAAAWWKVLTRSNTDLWGAQYRAEGAHVHV